MANAEIIRLSAEQGHRCAYCGVLLAVPGIDAKPRWPAPAAERRSFKYRKATRDHVVPRCDGGGDEWGNLVAACHWCNGFRGNQPANDAFERIQSQVRRGSHPHQTLARTGWWPRGFKSMRTVHKETADVLS